MLQQSLYAPADVSALGGDDVSDAVGNVAVTVGGGQVVGGIGFGNYQSAESAARCGTT